LSKRERSNIRPVPQNSGRDRRRALIEEAAVELNGRGVGQVSLGDVAARLGVTRTALYNYVEDQRDLVFQCYRHSCETLARMLNRARQQHVDALDCIEDFVGRMAEPGLAPIAAITDLAFLEEEQRDTIEGILSGILAELADVIERGMQAGTIRDCAPIVVARTILAFVSWPPLLPPTNPELVDDALPHLLSTTRMLLRWGIAADRRRLVRFEAPDDLRPSEPSANVFARSELLKLKKEALLARGSRLLNLKGIEETSLDEIAASLGVSKAVIYHNIGDKPTFVLECYRRAYRIALEIAVRMEASDGDRADALIGAMHMLAATHLRDDAPLLFPVVGFASVPPTIASETRDTNRQLQAIYSRAVECGITEGSVRPCDPSALLALLPAAIHWLDKWRALPAGCADDDANVAAEIARLVAIGLSTETA
jgi:AcrR family transcriptional regulator